MMASLAVTETYSICSRDLNPRVQPTYRMMMKTAEVSSLAWNGSLTAVKLTPNAPNRLR